MRLLPLLLASSLAGCGATTLDEFETCALDAVLSADAGAPGDEIVITGGPFTEARDTRVEVGGWAAEVRAVTRDGCDDCDDCKTLAGCPPCGLCPGIALDAPTRASCFGDPLASPPVEGSCASCVETIAFVVPAGPSGPVGLWFVNRNGASEVLPFTVLGGGTGHTGLPTTGETAAPGGTGATAHTGGPTGDTGGPTGTGGTGGTGDTAGPTGGTIGGTGDTGAGTGDTAHTGGTTGGTGAGTSATGDTGGGT